MSLASKQNPRNHLQTSLNTSLNPTITQETPLTTIIINAFVLVTQWQTISVISTAAYRESNQFVPAFPQVPMKRFEGSNQTLTFC